MHPHMLIYPIYMPRYGIRQQLQHAPVLFTKCSTLEKGIGKMIDMLALFHANS